MNFRPRVPFESPQPSESHKAKAEQQHGGGFGNGMIKGDRCFRHHIRLRRVTLCKEERKIVGIACRKAKSIEIDAGRFCRMEASKVKGQFVVDKHPNVIIPVKENT